VHGDTSAENQTILPKGDRRKRNDRRKKQLAVSIERRLLINDRRKTNFFAQDTEHSSGLGDTLGKFINTEV